MKASLPHIGISMDHETKETYSKLPWYALRENYCTCVSDHGALALPLPHDVKKMEAYIDLIDGLIITGGAFDVPTSYYSKDAQHDTVVTKDVRTQFEFGMTKLALERNMPVLGICGGEQLLNVVLGGTLIQHIPDTVKNALEHEQKNPRTEPGHDIAITPGSLLHRIVGKDTMAVNTAHHQAVDTPAPGMIASATSSDGVIEAIEHDGYDFCLGVQWHPEYAVDAKDPTILKAFVDAASAYRQKK